MCLRRRHLNNEAESYSSKSVLSSHKGGRRGGSNLLQFNQDCVHTRQVNTAQGCWDLGVLSVKRKRITPTGITSYLVGEITCSRSADGLIIQCISELKVMWIFIWREHRQESQATHAKVILWNKSLIGLKFWLVHFTTSTFSLPLKEPETNQSTDSNFSSLQ